MDKQRAAHVSEIKRIEEALKKTSSQYLRRDYEKHLKRLKKELRTYDRLKRNL